MSRGQGRVFRPTWTANGVKHTAKTWWLDYGVNGKQHREPANTKKRGEALELLRKRIGDRRAGKLTGSPDRVTLHELRGLSEKQYELDGRRSTRRLKECWGHLEGFFAAESRVGDVTTIRLDDYAASRLKAGRSRQTVNNELAALRRGFKLAIEKGLLATMPVFKLPKVRNARSGFFETGDLAALELELPEDVRPVVRFLVLTGWRVSEAMGLTWAAIDWDDQGENPGEPITGPNASIRLHGGQTKGGEARVFPFASAEPLKVLLEQQWAKRSGVLVFHRDGKPIRSFRRSWESAVRKAGLEGRLVHDLRRTFARDMRRAGVSEGEIMKLAGWRTRSMFDRYSIIAESDLSRAVALRFANRQVPAKTVPAATPSDSLTSSDLTTPL